MTDQPRPVRPYVDPPTTPWTQAHQLKDTATHGRGDPLRGDLRVSRVPTHARAGDVTDPTVTRASLADRGRHVRERALSRLVDIAYGDPDRYTPAVLIGRPHMIPVVVRDAMCSTHLPSRHGPPTTCGRCLRPNGGGHDDALLDQVRQLEPVALGRVLAVMDVLGDGDLPAPATRPAGELTAAEVADRIEALA